MKVHKIVLPTPYDVGDVNAFIVKGDALSIFDVGPKTEEAYEALKQGLHELGYRFNDIEQVILTHHHPDHAGWVDAFPKADIIGHEYVDHWMKKDEDFLSYRDAFYRHYLTTQGVPEEDIEKIILVRQKMEWYGNMPLTKHLKEGDEVPGHPELITYYTPGHAQSHLVFYNERSGEMIGGDMLLEKIASNPLIEPPTDLSFERPKTLVQYQSSLELIRDLGVSTLFTGHGGDIHQVNNLIHTRLQKDADRANQLFEILTEPKTVYEVTKWLYPTAYKSQLGLTLSKTQGYLDLLVKEERIQCVKNGNIDFYTR